MPNILLVEDEQDVRDYYVLALTRAGFEVKAVEDSESALQNFEASLTDLVLLDITLGDDTEAGFSLCTKIRALSERVPIIFLTSSDGDIERISGLRLGADDYITKNVSIDYLVIRIKTLLQRIDILTGKNAPLPTSELNRGDLYINMDILTVKWKDKLVNLSLTQLWMVYALVSHRGYVRTRQQLMDAANITIEPATVVVYIKNIRQLFQEVDADFSAIKNERGLGYRWVTDD